jgi:hypothetical protein
MICVVISWLISSVNFFDKSLCSARHTQKQIRVMLGSCLTQALLLVMSLTWGLTLHRR